MTRSVWLYAATAALIPAADAAIFAHNFEKNGGGWNIPSYWGGKVERVDNNARGGRYALKLVSTEKNKKNFGRMMVAIRQPEVVAGGKFKLSFYAKGTGRILPVLLCVSTDAKGKNVYRYNMDKDGEELTPQYRKYEKVFDLTQTDTQKITPIIEVRGGEAFIDDVRFEQVSDPDAKMTAVSTHFVGKAGDKMPALAFAANPKAKVAIIARSGSLRPQVASVAADDGGRVSTVPAVPARDLVRVTASNGGSTADVYCSFLDAKTYAGLDAAAKKIKLAKPMRILWIGDSLSDFDRGYNFVDKLGFFLNRYNPGKAVIRNAAVRGDYIDRVLERIDGIDGKKKIYRQVTYDQLFDGKYDLAVIFLGHNDTRIATTKTSTQVLIPPQRQEADYRKLFSILKTRAGNPAVLLLTPTASDEVGNRAKVAKNVQAGRIGHFYGDPQTVQAYNAVLAKLAKEYHFALLDLYTPMRKLNNPKKYLKDGVHLSPDGILLVSGQVLEKFAELYPAK